VTVLDFVMPSFLFIIGVCAALVFKDWKQEARADPVTSTFEVEHYTVAGQGTVTESETESAAATEETAEPVIPDQGSPSQGQWSINADLSAGSNQSTPPGSPAEAIEFATPPTGETVNSEGVPMRFRTLDNRTWELSALPAGHRAMGLSGFSK